MYSQNQNTMMSITTSPARLYDKIQMRYNFCPMPDRLHFNDNTSNQSMYNFVRDKLKSCILIPNPISNEAFLILNNDEVGQSDYMIDIYDITGRKLTTSFEIAEIPTNNSPRQFHLINKNAPSGTYFIKIITAASSDRIQFILK